MSNGLVGSYRSSKSFCHSYFLAIHPLSLASQVAYFNSLSTARIIESPSSPRSIGFPFFDSNCSLTIIFTSLVCLVGFCLYRNVTWEVYFGFGFCLKGV